jgi:predicted nucleic acid-binding Zn ribbon protein
MKYMDEEARKKLLHQKNIRLVWLLVAIALASMVVTMLKR